MKGGVGKSTLAAQLAWQFAAMTKWSKKVLVIDMDPQFNVSQYMLGIKHYKEIIDANEPTIWDIFEQFTQTPGVKKKAVDLERCIHNVTTFISKSKIDIIPSRLELAFSLRNPAQKETLVSKFISKVENNYDLIFVDCPPTESLLTTAAYLTSDYVLVPVKPEFLSTIGLPLLVNSLEEFHSRYEGHNIELAGVVFNATTDYSPEEVISKQEVQRVAKQYGWYVFENQVRYSRSYPKSAREGRPIFWTSYARQEQAHRFHKFAIEFSERIDL
jgi:chromosome partitioning protein